MIINYQRITGLIEMDLDTLREEIRQKDLEIARLISERTELTKKVGDYKVANGIPIRNKEVESKVIGRYVELGSGYGLSPMTMSIVASALIKEAVSQESRLIRADDPKKVAIIGGAGKMGKWMSDMLSSAGHEVSVIDPAVKNGLTIKDCSSSDIVIVSVPIHAVNDTLVQLDDICRKDTLIFDISSLKTSAVGTLRKMAKTRKVCSVHPMFGPSAESLYDRNVIVCDCGNPQAVEEAKALFDDRGGDIRIMEVEEHDSYMSYVLGLTHAVNIALFTVLQRSGYDFADLLTVSSTTFSKGLDTNMSVASEDPRLYYEIQHMNGYREKMWSLFSGAVEDLKKASLDDDPSDFIRIMDAGKRYFQR